jgi:hypothetical protein
MNPRIDHILSLDDQIASIDALVTSAQQHKRERFRELYEPIERALDRKTPVKTIRAQLHQLGLHLSAGTFQKLLEAERRERAKRGEPTRCAHCGALGFASSQHVTPAESSRDEMTNEPVKGDDTRAGVTPD